MSNPHSDPFRGSTLARAISAMALVAASALAPNARAQDATDRAREEFVTGSERVKQSQWAEALAAYERSAKLRAHAVTTFNIGFCQRALGQYTRARQTFQESLAAHARAPELSDSLVQEANGYLVEIERLLVRARVNLAPQEAKVTVDGRPLLVVPGATPTLVAGVRAPGDGETPPAPRFQLVLDPGAHVIVIRRKGFADAVVNQSFAPGSQPALESGDRSPAGHAGDRLQRGARGRRARRHRRGAAPLALSRPAGAYRVVVRKPDFVPVRGADRAPAGRDHAAARGSQARVALGPHALVVLERRRGDRRRRGRRHLRGDAPGPERPAVNSGGLGWAVEVP